MFFNTEYLRKRLDNIIRLYHLKNKKPNHVVIERIIIKNKIIIVIDTNNKKIDIRKEYRKKKIKK